MGHGICAGDRMREMSWNSGPHCDLYGLSALLPSWASSLVLKNQMFCDCIAAKTTRYYGIDIAIFLLQILK